MDRIVVGVDQSTGAQRALEWALEQAKMRPAALRLVSAMPVPQPYYPYPAMAAMPSEESRLAAARQAAEQVLTSALAKAGGEPPEISVELTPRLGPAAEVLVEESEDAALLVVGSRGRGGFAGLLLGSVSQQVVHHARCPVVVIPTED